MLREAEHSCSHLKSLKSFVDYDLGMRHCWLIARILENKWFSFSLLPPKSLIAELLCREQFLPLFDTEQNQNLFATVRIQRCCYSWVECPELSCLLLTSFSVCLAGYVSDF